jgi:RHS repeat-associated protein
MRNRRPNNAVAAWSAAIAAALICWSLAAAAVDKSGVRPGSISLPSGPGSIEGLGESFQPTLNTGTAKYAVPLRVPPGTAGHAPGLVLRYDGGAGNGAVGFGWKLALPYVQRQSDKGIPRYVDGPNGLDDDRDGTPDNVDEIDVFINDLGEELVPQSDGYYFCENEGAFIRYERSGGGWIGTMPNGTRMEFGMSADSRVEDTLTARVYTWLLESMTDSNGNVINFSYTTFPGDSNQHQKYLSKIAYGPGAPPWDNYHFVALAYESRADWFEDCRAGFCIRTGMRLAAITAGTQGPTLADHAQGDFDGDTTPDNLVRRYELGYETDPHWSLLSSVTLIGADDSTALPPTTFEYTLCNAPDLLSANGHIISGVNEPLKVMDNDFVELVDLNGDALPDIVRTELDAGAHTAYINKGESGGIGTYQLEWSAGVPMSSVDGLAFGVDLSNTSNIAHLADMDGDGLSDLTYTSPLGDVYYFANTGSLGWGMRRTMSVLDAAPPSPFDGDTVRTADVDFDKRMDIVQSIDTGFGADYKIWFNLGNQQYAQSTTVGESDFIRFDLSGVEIADFNGDRVPDVCRIRPTGIDVLPGMGYGAFGEQITVSIPDFALTTQQIETARLHDITGNGLVDLVIERAEPGVLWYWLNRGTYELDTRRRITGMPTGIGIEAESRWADINGNGTTDFVFADAQSVPRIQSLDIGRLLGCVPRPNLLTKIDNGIGRVTTITYAPSTQFALADADNGAPWPDPMPFAVSVVSRVTLDDSLGNTYETNFAYHDGYYDGGEKEFRGFGRVEQIEEGDATAPTLVTRHYFDTGRDTEALKGKLLRKEAEVASGSGERRFWEEISAWNTRTLMTGTDGKDVVFPFNEGIERNILERGEGDAQTIEVAFEYDDYGNLTANREYGIVEGSNPSAGDDERITLTEFAYNLTDWLVRYPVREELRDLGDNVISRRETYYDDPAFGAGNFGVVTKGNVTLVRDWVDPAMPTDFIDTQRMQYDAFGNVTGILDALALAPGGAVDDSAGHYRSMSYDTLFHAYPVAETIHVGDGSDDLVVSVAYDEGFGVITESTDFNGHATDYGYDALGRLTQVVRPGDTTAYPTTEYTYALAAPVGGGKTVNYIETAKLDREPGSAGAEKRDHYFFVRSFLDGLGRNIMTRGEAELDPNTSDPRVVVTGAVTFNARRSAAAVLGPFYTTMPGDLDARLAFEEVTAPAWEGVFHEGGALVSRTLAGAHKLTFEYDALLRERRITNPDDTYREKVYEPLLIRTADENDTDALSPHFETPMVHHIDGLGRLVQVDEITRLNDDGTESLNLNTWTTRYEYRADDVLTRTIDAQQNERIMSYDGLGRKLVLNDPDRGLLTCSYDEASNLVHTVDAKGQEIVYTYDGVNRLLTEDYLDEALPFSANLSPDVQYHYDTPAGAIDTGTGTNATAENTQGFLSYIEHLAGEEHNSFDARGRVAWTINRVPDPYIEVMSSYQTGFTYDSFDRLDTLTYPDGDSCTHAYNARGRLESISGGTALNGGTDFVLESVEYAPSAQLLSCTYGNGTTTQYGYDERNRLTQLDAGPDTSPPPFLDLAYSFDGASNITGIEDNRLASQAPEGDPRRNTQSFAYDDLNRLTRVDYSFNLPGEPLRDDGYIAYRYDRIGNMLSKDSDLVHQVDGKSITDFGNLSYGGSGGASGRVGRTTAVPGPHAVTAASGTTGNRAYGYDRNGNMTHIDGLACTWDFKDRVVIAEDEDMRAEYVYDYADRRVLKKVWKKDSEGATGPAPKNASVYVNRYFELREGDQPVKYVWQESQRIARVTGRLEPTAQRTQTMRVYEGWNFLTLAVQASDAAAQLGMNTNPAVEAVFRMDPVTEGLTTVNSGTALPRGALLWVRATEPALLRVTGNYSDPSPVNVPTGKRYFSPNTLNTLVSAFALPSDKMRALVHDNAEKTWLSEVAGPAMAFSTLPAFIGAGDPVFVDTETMSTIEDVPPEKRIAYYYQDHLQSATVVADGTGNVIDETAYYPYGYPRNEHRPAPARGVLPSHYGFSHKEQDRETDLHYFEARYLVSALGAFASPDPVVTGRPIQNLPVPQGLNPYAYTLRNPLIYRDVTGLTWADLGNGFIEQGKGLGMYAGISLLQGESPDIPWAELGWSSASKVLQESENSLIDLKNSGGLGQKFGAIAGLAAVRSAQKIVDARGDTDWGEVIWTTAASTALGETARELGIEEFFQADSGQEAAIALSNIGRRAIEKELQGVTAGLSNLGGDNEIGNFFGSLLNKAVDYAIEKGLDFVFKQLNKGIDAAFESGAGEYIEKVYDLTKVGLAEDG